MRSIVYIRLPELDSYYYGTYLLTYALCYSGLTHFFFNDNHNDYSTVQLFDFE